MALFVYCWKTPDNARHEGEIEAPDREVAFARLRERGIRAIKVEPKGWKTGQGYRGVRRRVAVTATLVASLLAGGVAYWLGKGDSSARIVVQTAYGPVEYYPATPLERQLINGDRRRIEHLPPNLFKYPLEKILAKYAEPGRVVANADVEALRELSRGKVAECLKTPVHIASSDFTEHADLKRIVVGMKKELAAFLDGGGTVTQYCAELVKRQKMEAAYRGKAETRLTEMLSDKEKMKDAYGYWLKANASLESMGIYPLPIPEELRAYQMSIDLD